MKLIKHFVKDFYFYVICFNLDKNKCQIGQVNVSGTCYIRYMDVHIVFTLILTN